MRAIVGVASIPMASLAAGVPVEGAFKLTNPITKRPAGRIILGLGWHNPLQLPGTAPQGERAWHLCSPCGRGLVPLPGPSKSKPCCAELGLVQQGDTYIASRRW